MRCSRSYTLRMGDREANPLGGQAQQREILATELPRRLGAGHEHARDHALGEQRHADSESSCASIASRVAATRRANASPPALLAGRRGAHREPVVLVRQVDRRLAGVEHAADLGNEVPEDAVEAPLRERGVDERLHAADELRHALRLGARGLLAYERLALRLPSQALGHVRDEAGHEHLAARLELRDGGLAREAPAVAALELDLEVLGGRGLLGVDQRLPALVVALLVLGRDDQLTHRPARPPPPRSSRRAARPPRSR